MDLLLILLLLFLFIICYTKKDIHEGFIALYSNPVLAGSIIYSNTKDKIVGVDEAPTAGIYDIQEYIKYPKDKAFVKGSTRDSIEEIKDKNLDAYVNAKVSMKDRLIQLNDYDEHIIELEREIKEDLRNEIKKQIEEDKQCVSIMPKAYTDPRDKIQADDYILGFDKSIPDVVSRQNSTKKCIGAWGEWNGNGGSNISDICKEQVDSCNKIYRKWKITDMGDGDCEKSKGDPI